MNEPYDDRKNTSQIIIAPAFKKRFFCLFVSISPHDGYFLALFLGLRMASDPEAVVTVTLFIYYSLDSDGSSRPLSSGKMRVDIWPENESHAIMTLAGSGICSFFFFFLV